MRAVLDYRAGPGFLDRIGSLKPDWLEVAVVHPGSDQEAPALETADVLLHVLEPVTAQAFSAAKGLRLVQKLGVGVNTIDLDAARAHGCAVANMPGTNTQAVAEATVALLLAVTRRVPTVDRVTRAGQGWGLGVDLADGFRELGDKTVGLVGYGAVASRLAPILVAFGCRVLYTSAHRKDDAVAEWRTLEDLLVESDVVSLHCPLTPQTESLIDAAALASMKPGAVLVNTARGGLVDEAALLDALRSGRLAGAGLDVFRDEPVEADHPLLGLDNVVVSPHVAWLSGETLDRSLRVAFDNCRRLQEGRPLLHQVVPAPR